MIRSPKLHAVLAAMLIAVMVLSACGATETPSPAPTVEPTAEPMALPPTAEPAAEAPDPGALTANPWQWVSFTDPLQQFDVEMPESYLLVFNEDGTVNIKADCNNAMGSYTEDGGSLAIEVGPMTRAACLPESRSDQFVALLGSAARYFFEDAQLYIDLMADGGTMVFAPEGEAELAQAAASRTGDASAIAVEDLRNATYSGIYDEPVTLTDGMYEKDPFTVQYVEGTELFGDLDGDGVEDAVVFLLERGGGTGAFTYIAAQLNKGGQPVDAGAVWMDEISVRSAAIEDGQVVAELIVIGPGDADCCGSHKAARTYALQEGQLAEVSGEEGDLEQVSAADLDGTEWILLELDYDQTVAADAEVTIGFQDGQIAGSGGCNNYTGSFDLGEENPFAMTIGPVAATKMACPEPILGQETAYLAALESVSGWNYYFGRLALYYYVEDQAGLSRLLFAPVEEAESAGDVTSYPWLWTSFTSPVEQFDIESPQDYVVTFSDDGTVVIKADCNNAQGSYTVDAGSLAIEVGPMTMAACPPESRSDQFVTLLGSAARYFFEDAQLYVDLLADGGTMVFAPEGEAELAEAAAQSAAGSGLPPAEIANDEGGPAVVSGEWNYTAAAVATHYLEPVAVLLDVSRQIQGNYTEWVPRSGQIMGTLTRPLAPAPTAYEVDVPVQPGGASADLDNDGEEDAGIQIYAAVLGTNLVGDSYLEQIEQEGFTSYLPDPQTGAIRQGTFLVYAPDDAQGFPSSAGDDGIFFTEDDPAVGLPAGWTLVTLSDDGEVSFDRSREATMDVLEAAAFASPDFSDQGILESYHSLIDVLSVRYSYTDLRGLDWEAIREEYLPRVEAADEADDFAAYYAAMNDLALSIKDTHVYVFTNVPQYTIAAYALQDQYFGAGLGAQVVELDDGRFAVIYLDPEGPGAEAGWQFGTEIVSVDGVPIGERIETLPITKGAGNPEIIRLNQTELALAFPAGTETTIEYRQPGESELRSVTLTAEEGAFAFAPGLSVEDADISFKKLEGSAFYVQWKAFRDPLYKMAVWEKFLADAQGAPGIIIDMRHNGGGATDLLYTMASYFFTAKDPAPYHWIDNYSYDEKANDLVQEFATDYTLSSPRPELTFNGAVAVLVGKDSASAAEYLPQFLQRQGRAIVVGEHGSEGAGGYLEYVSMPGDFTFHFTKGRTFFAGTDELNLEAKGVDLDVRVPITLENEQAKQEGRDVVLETALVALGEEAARRASEQLPGTTWQLVNMNEVLNSGASNKYTIETPESYAITFGEDGAMSIQADCNQAQAEYTLGAGGALAITLGATTLAECPEGSLSEKFLAGLGGAASFQTDGAQMVITANTEEGVVIMLFQISESAESATAEPSSGNLPADLVSQLDAWLESQVYTEGGNPANATPGLVLLVETPEGRYLKAAGVSSLEEGTPMQVDDILEIGSNTKSFTVVLIMQLQEEGVLSLEDNLSKWLPEQAAIIPHGDEITLHQLANHISGIPDYTGPVMRPGMSDPEKLAQGYTPEELVQMAVDNDETHFLPGEGFSYNNTGYILLGMVAEAATGQPLAELYQERIFDPLGLETAVFLQDSPKQGEITTQGYFPDMEGGLMNTTAWNASQGGAAGAIAMSAEDLATYGKALANGGLLQDPDSLAQMLVFNPDGIASIGSYGLGLFSLGDGYWGHEGTTLAFQSLWFINPEKGNLAVGLSNSSGYSANNFSNVLNILEGRGAQPLVGFALSPAAEFDYEAFATRWQWSQITDASGETAIDSGPMITLQKDGVVTLQSDACGSVTGTYTAGPSLTLAFDLDTSALSCPEDDPMMELLGYLDMIDSWRYENGGMVIVLTDGTELAFSNPY